MKDGDEDVDSKEGLLELEGLLVGLLLGISVGSRVGRTVDGIDGLRVEVMMDG